MIRRLFKPYSLEALLIQSRAAPPRPATLLEIASRVERQLSSSFPHPVRWITN